VWVRFVLVPGLTDDREEIARLAGFAASLRNVERVDVLPFHQMGRFKWEKLGLPYSLAETRSLSADVVQEACELFRAAGLRAV
jgi:pyruvate formate lyase activating enzyme